jgi:hypothetical protein
MAGRRRQRDVDVEPQPRSRPVAETPRAELRRVLVHPRAINTEQRCELGRVDHPTRRRRRRGFTSGKLVDDHRRELSQLIGIQPHDRTSHTRAA